MKIRDLNINDYIWFKAPNSTISYPAIVTELIYNDDEPLAIVKIGNRTDTIDDSYDFAIGEKRQ